MFILQIILLLALLALSIFTLLQILAMRTLLPKEGSLSQVEIAVPGEYLQSPPSTDLLNAIYAKTKWNVTEKKLESVALISHDAGQNEMNRLMRRLNMYLLTRHFSFADTGWMKDTVEEHVSKRERPLLYLLLTPLAIGGLCRVMSSGSDLTENLLGGMGLGLGLVFTIVLIFIYFLTVQKNNLRKQACFDFLQLVLAIPSKASLEDQMRSLQNELASFSQKQAAQVQKMISANADQLQAMHTVQQEQVKAINRETEMLEQISKTDFPQIVRFNTETLEQLKATMQNFGLFNHLASSLGALLGTMDKLTSGIGDGLERTGEIKRISEAILDSVKRNGQLEELLVSNVKVLADRKSQVQQLVGGVDEVLSKAIAELSEHTQKQLISIKEITARENNLLDESLGKSRDRMEKLGRLDELVDEMKQVRLLEVSSHQLHLQMLTQLEKLNIETEKVRVKLEKRRWF